MVTGLLYQLRRVIGESKFSEQFIKIINQYKSIKYNEPAHDKTNNQTCATSEDSDRPVHPRSLNRVFADHR